MINPVWLRSFCTLVEVGHFTRTADILNMTQSGVSQHVRKLEEYLATPLLMRQGKGFTLTGAGERLYKEGQALLLSFANLEKQIGRDPSHEGVVKVASPGSVGLKLYPHLLQLQARYPRLIIEYRFAPNHEIERLIAEHKVDLGLMTCVSTLGEVKLTPIADEALLLVTPAAVAEPSWAQLMALGFVDHPDGAYHAGQLLSVNFPEFQHSSQFKRSGFSNQINMILEPVSMGLGFTVLPRYAVAAFAGAEKVNVHPLMHPVSETLYMGTHLRKFAPNCVNTVISEIETCLQGR
ncbi:LysR family transcriptional regulator [Neptuniibacter pectenicola]|uniref:LysR family transcriptional regulator n=1 Tax=Neptuniibacter pectenicola TaxID=1806669 RepID=UPI00082C15B2|nr:LysR family transcriptional regulator [Neptuniibacter pectenicola]